VSFNLCFQHLKYASPTTLNNSKVAGEFDDCQISTALELCQDPKSSRSRRALGNLIEASVTADRVCHRNYEFPSMQVITYTKYVSMQVC
jgi:hypothetical protein